MKRLFAAIFLSTLLFLPSTAQEALPPSGARVIPGGTGVAFSWPGSQKEKYFLQVTTGQVIVTEQDVTGNRHTVQLKPGLGYQWKVSRIVTGGYQELVPARSFQVISETEMIVNGTAGKNGKVGTYRSHYRGEDGENGKAGVALTATLTPIGNYVSLLITGAPANRQYYFSPGAAPLVLSSVGGKGGDGGAGYKGRDGSIVFGTRAVTLAESGGDGGQGGQGGDGGAITVISNGLPVERYLQFDTRGGDGGRAGLAGPGGRPPTVPIQQERRYGYALVPGQSGLPGQPGAPGRDGLVVIR